LWTAELWKTGSLFFRPKKYKPGRPRGDDYIGFSFNPGEFVHPVSEMNIVDNHLKIWQRLPEAANDPNPYGPQRISSLVFIDVVVSGI